MNIVIANLILQLGLILLIVRLCGRLAGKLNIPSVLGDVLAGIIIGPYALGSVPLPGFRGGIFPLENFVVSSQLYVFASIALIILLFIFGLQTDISLFLKFSIAGGIIGFGGLIISFFFGCLVGVFFFNLSFYSPQCMFLGIMCIATSVSITSRLLSSHKKMETSEGVSILTAAVFDDIMGVIALIIILALTALMIGGDARPGLAAILAIVLKTFGIWLGFTTLGIVYSRRIAGFLKKFRNSYDFSIFALGAAMLLAGFFERQGLTMVIGAYITGLSLSKTDIAMVIEERLFGLYKFFIPVFFVVMGMMVNIREIFSPQFFILCVVYTLAAILAKIIGCGGSAFLLGFNVRGSLRIGFGMIPRSEVALILAAVGLTSGILDQTLFGMAVFMSLLTSLLANPFINIAFKIKGSGTKRPVKGDDSASASWKFLSREMALLAGSTLLQNLKNQGFYVQKLSIDDRISQARKDDIALTLTVAEDCIIIGTGKTDMPFAKKLVHDLIVELHESIKKLREYSDPENEKKDFLKNENSDNAKLLSIITPDYISMDLKGGKKEEIIAELVDILEKKGRLTDRNLALKDVLDRENTMSTGMSGGIALPHAKSDGVNELCVAVGIKKEGMDFESSDGKKSKLFILVLSPRKTSGPHIQFIATITGVLRDDVLRQDIINAQSPDEVVKLLQNSRNEQH